MSKEEHPLTTPAFRFQLGDMSPTTSDATASLDLSMGVATDLLGSHWRSHRDGSPGGVGRALDTPAHGGPVDDGDATTTIVSESDAH